MPRCPSGASRRWPVRYPWRVIASLRPDCLRHALERPTPCTNAVELAERLRAAGLEPGAWSNGPSDRYPPHAHDYDKVLVCGAGSIRFGLPDRGVS